MKSDALFLTITVALAGIAGYFLIARRATAAAAPPAGLQYHPVQNPNGYTFYPSANGGGQWSKVTPSGEPVYWSDVL